MPVFGRNRRSRADPRHLSANVEERDESWHVTWLVDGKDQPPEFRAASLDEVTDVATKGALALYTAGPRPPGAVLSFAIYPRGHGKKELLYDVSRSHGQFTARDMQDGTHQVQAANLEQLVEAVREQAQSDYAMLFWVRPLEEFPIPPRPG